MQRDIEHIEHRAADMAAHAEASLRLAFQALETRDRKLAYAVIVRDRYIDELEVELDHLCLEFLVRHQPAGTHLRFAYATMKLDSDLERVGDCAESIARQVLKLRDPAVPLPSPLFQELATLAIGMVHDSMQAFLRRDADLARATMAAENRADALREQLQEQLFRARDEGRIAAKPLQAVLTAVRRFERVTDQCENICEDVLYLCTGEYARHHGQEALHVLFVDQANACASQMAEAIGRALKPAGVTFDSAGVRPQPVDPLAVRFLATRGIQVPVAVSKPLTEIPDMTRYRVIVTLDPAAQDAFPRAPGKAVVLPWSLPPDPATTPAVTPDDTAPYEALYHDLEANVRDLLQAVMDPVAASGDNRHA